MSYLIVKTLDEKRKPWGPWSAERVRDYLLTMKKGETVQIGKFKVTRTNPTSSHLPPEVTWVHGKKKGKGMALDLVDAMEKVGAIKESLLVHRQFGELSEKKWQTLPRGWTQASLEKFWGKLTGRSPKHKVTACMKKMEGKVSDPGAFCASLMDRVSGSTKWRSEVARKKREGK